MCEKLVNLLGRNFGQSEFVDENPVLVGGDALGARVFEGSVGSFVGLVQVRRILVQGKVTNIDLCHRSMFTKTFDQK